VRHLTPAEIAEADKVPLSCAIPKRWKQRTKPGKEQWLITMGVHPSGLCAAGHGAG
jgi:ubiquinol-cytochrome c reductase iron-sulfur subunit